MKSAIDLYQVAEQFEELGDYSRAERLYKKALQRVVRNCGHDAIELAPYLYNLGLILYANDKDREGNTILHRLLEILVTRLGSEHPDVREVREQLFELHGVPRELMTRLTASA